eukprot:TRINITY_DN7253_c0_g1_i1.p1 TRINITY_DN7253_c0_g1~~TRINITY_DN7253_c0_g1_i1.p1  ORF type:complete len:463 (+),score=175.49 TRINITY_DN7253_c0_g1_i1:55-1389(+)
MAEATVVDADCDDSLRRNRTLLDPIFHSDKRQATVAGSVFNLVCTILGGAVLSLPWAVARAGLVAGLLSILAWGVLNDFTIYLLVTSARRSGAMSYEMLADVTFGSRLRLFVIALIAAVTWLVIIAYLLLSGQLAVALYGAVFGNVSEDNPWAKRVSLSVVVLLALPASCMRSLHAVRYLSMLSLAAVVVLIGMLGMRTAQRLADRPLDPVQLWPHSWLDLFYTLPIFCNAFVCHFNVLPIHCELERPTRRRMRSVLHLTIGMCVLVYVAVALLGYLYAQAGTCESILENFCTADPAIAGARIALLAALVTSMPLMVLPCRANLNRLGEMIAPEGYRKLDADGANETMYRILGTLALVGSALAVAIAVPSVTVVWTLVGATGALTIAFILPTLMYLRVDQTKPVHPRKVQAVVVLILAVIAAVISLSQALQHLESQPCSTPVTC